jgi:hypothetical protein
MYKSGLLLVLAAALVLPEPARSASKDYTFEAIAYAGDPAPGGGTFTLGLYGEVFMNNWISNNGVVVFTAGVTDPEGGQGTFMLRNGQITEILRSGQPAPGGGVFALAAAGPGAAFTVDRGAVVSDSGDVALSTMVEIAGGTYAGVYRYSPQTGMLSAILVPGVTPVPGTDVTFIEAYSNHGSIGTNNRGDVVFVGVYPTTEGLFGYLGRGVGVFTASPDGAIEPAVMIGEPAPSGDTFDFFRFPLINNRGDVFFAAHEAADPIPPELLWFCEQWLIAPPSGLYIKDGGTGQVRVIMTGSDPHDAPSLGATNDRADVLFAKCWWIESGYLHDVEIFLNSGGTTYPVCLLGETMPGGGHVETVADWYNDNWLNNRGDVVFSATLDTCTLGYYDPNTNAGLPDEGLYVWSRGAKRLLAKTGTALPGIGTLAYLETVPIPPPPEWYWPFDMLGYWSPVAISHMNDRGQVIFQATLTDGRWVLLVATPKAR